MTRTKGPGSSAAQKFHRAPLMHTRWLASPLSFSLPTCVQVQLPFWIPFRTLILFWEPVSPLLLTLACCSQRTLSKQAEPTWHQAYLQTFMNQQHEPTFNKRYNNALNLHERNNTRGHLCLSAEHGLLSLNEREGDCPPGNLSRITAFSLRHKVKKKKIWVSKMHVGSR